MKRLLRILFILLILGGLGGAGYWYLKNRPASAATGAEDTGSYTQIVTVERGNLSATLSVVGQLEAVQSTALKFEKMTGTSPLLTLAVQTGGKVTAGQVLATIDPASYQQALDQAKSDLQAAEQTLTDLQTPATDLEIAQADVAIAKAELQLQQAQNSLDELLNPDLAGLESAVVSARGTLVQAEADLLALQEDSSTDDQLSRLAEADADAYAAYAEWLAKDHAADDDVYNDRLTLLYDKMKDAQDALVTAQVQANLTLLQAEMSVRKNQRSLDDAQEALAEAKAGGDELAVARAKLAVSEAQVAIELAHEARAELDEGPDATALATAQADLDKKRLVVSDAEAALAGCELVAPFDGTILELSVNAGDTVAANTPIATLADLKSLQVVASVDETTIRQVTAGQTAAIGFDAYPGQSFDGAVLSVPLQGSLQGGVTVYDVPLSLSGAEGLNLLVGMTANVEISIGEAADALLVPTLALSKVSGQYQVSVPNTLDPAGEPETVPVQVGLSDGTYTQVLKGLNEGDQVLVTLSTGTEEIFPGMMMEVRNAGGGVIIMEGGGPPGGGAVPAAPPSGGSQP